MPAAVGRIPLALDQAALHAVDSVDSAALAAALAQRAREAGRTLEVLLQVNVDREAQKAGVSPEDLPALIDHVRSLPELSLRVVLLALGVLGFVALSAGVIPAWRASRVDPASTLRME